MKMRRLPDLDIARIGPMPREQKKRELEQMKLAFPPYSYDPMRRTILDIFNVQAGPLAPLPRTSLESVKAAIRTYGRGEEERDANLRVAEGLYLWAEDNSVSGRREEFHNLSIGVSEKLTYWSPAVLSLDGRAVVPFIDPRKAKKLTAEARLFAFSAMHERIRAADPDFAAVALGIFQFTNPGEGPRRARLFLDDGLTLYSFDDLDAMVRETYELWREVLEEREAAARRAGDGGPLFRRTS